MVSMVRGVLPMPYGDNVASNPASKGPFGASGVPRGPSGQPLKPVAHLHVPRLEASDFRVLIELDAAYLRYARQARVLCEVATIARMHPILGDSNAGRVQISLCVHTTTLADAIATALRAVQSASPWKVREVQRDLTVYGVGAGRTVLVSGIPADEHVVVFADQSEQTAVQMAAERAATKRGDGGLW